MALSTTSQTRWCRPADPTPPMYIPGRLRTGSSPSRTVMSFAEYDDAIAGDGTTPVSESDVACYPPATRSGGLHDLWSRETDSVDGVGGVAGSGRASGVGAEPAREPGVHRRLHGMDTS